jgi:hypothetical protein
VYIKSCIQIHSEGTNSIFAEHCGEVRTLRFIPTLIEIYVEF